MIRISSIIFLCQVLDQKTSSVLGQLTYAIALLLKQKDLSMLTQPIMLQKSGPESKILLSLQLKVSNFFFLIDIFNM